MSCHIDCSKAGLLQRLRKLRNLIGMQLSSDPDFNSQSNSYCGRNQCSRIH